VRVLRCRNRAEAESASLDFGAEPSRWASRSAGRGLTRGHVLEAHGQRPRSRTEADDDRHLHDRSRGLRRHDAPDSGSLVRGDQLGEVTDLGPDAVRRPADGLPQRPRASQYLHDHLGELPGQRGGLARCRRQRGRPGCSGRRRRLAGDMRIGRGRLARHRARGAMGLAIVRWPARRDRDEPQPGECGRLARGGAVRWNQWLARGGAVRWNQRVALAGGGRRVRREGSRRHVSSSRSGECERPRTPLAAAFASGSGWTRLYLRPPTFRRPAWLRIFHGLDERRSPIRRISV